MSQESQDVPAIVESIANDSDNENSDNVEDSASSPGLLARNASFKERQNFADAEESESSPRTSAKIRAQRKRLGSRSSRQNSNSERSFRAGSTSPFVVEGDNSTSDEAEPVPADSTEDEEQITKKRRYKRIIFLR